ncbi:unnamed protein product [Cyprideis torosa]|uniref:Uncharacterized protein n=1 Tax=Cyprideis torosa TaxID=163714 RepID=A0A7R8WHL8_9CRUS|nr:unnamed protein product [Cyprideis torosa]CAG0893951.1 unnamed protein product [Cyprideis torosa]
MFDVLMMPALSYTEWQLLAAVLLPVSFLVILVLDRALRRFLSEESWWALFSEKEAENQETQDRVRLGPTVMASQFSRLHPCDQETLEFPFKMGVLALGLDCPSSQLQLGAYHSSDRLDHQMLVVLATLVFRWTEAGKARIQKELTAVNALTPAIEAHKLATMVRPSPERLDARIRLLEEYLGDLHQQQKQYFETMQNSLSNITQSKASTGKANGDEIEQLGKELRAKFQAVLTHLQQQQQVAAAAFMSPAYPQPASMFGLTQPRVPAAYPSAFLFPPYGGLGTPAAPQGSQPRLPGTPGTAQTGFDGYGNGAFDLSTLADQGTPAINRHELSDISTAVGESMNYSYLQTPGSVEGSPHPFQIHLPPETPAAAKPTSSSSAVRAAQISTCKIHRSDFAQSTLHFPRIWGLSDGVVSPFVGATAALTALLCMQQKLRHRLSAMG